MRSVMRKFTLPAVLLPLLATTAWAWYPYSEKYERWQEPRPLTYAAMHNCVPRDCLPERMARFAAANLNTLIWFKPMPGCHMFQAAHDAGLAWACGTRGGQEAVAAALAIPGCAFIIAGDEPGSTEALDQIAAISDWVRRTYPDLPVFANLSITKVDHDSYIQKCKPDLFSFDEYPLLRDGKLAQTYLYDLAWGRQTASRYRLPYWMFLQAFGREHERPDYAYRVPGEADLRFLVFSFLAHGGTGIMFFIYYGFPEAMVMDLGVEDPERSPAENHRYENTVMTAAWYAVREVAPEVQNLARALLNLRTKDQVMYAGDGTFWEQPPPTYPNNNPAEPIRLQAFAGHGALRSIRVVEGQDLGLMIGFLEDEAGQEYFMMVNLAHGLNMSKMDGVRRVRLTFDRSVEQVERLSRFTGDVETLRTHPQEEAAVLDMSLEGGTGDLFKWSNGKPWRLRQAP
ncbi:MAG TPA: hypothetical protein VM221_04945 [Armatimonadota bacterium]|nr:hypothetical protein [Armatimonadota bacterium]